MQQPLWVLFVVNCHTSSGIAATPRMSYLELWCLIGFLLCLIQATISGAGHIMTRGMAWGRSLKLYFKNGISKQFQRSIVNMTESPLRLIRGPWERGLRRLSFTDGCRGIYQHFPTRTIVVYFRRCFPDGPQPSCSRNSMKVSPYLTGCRKGGCRKKFEWKGCPILRAFSREELISWSQARLRISSATLEQSTWREYRLISCVSNARTVRFCG